MLANIQTGLADAVEK